MSANVWFEEVNIGLINELRNTIKVKNYSGVLAFLPENAFTVRKPEEDFKSETYPCVSIYPLDYKHNPLRYNPNPVAVGYDKENKVINLEDQAVSFDLGYQIDFWAKYQTDMDDMMKTWLMKHFRQFNLSVVDDGGVTRSCNVLAEGSFFRSDLVQNKERLFHAFGKYRIWVEIDDETVYNKPMVDEVNLNAHGVY